MRKSILLAILLVVSGAGTFAQQVRWEKVPSPNGIMVRYALELSSGDVVLYSHGLQSGVSHLYRGTPPFDTWEQTEVPGTFGLPLVELENGALISEMNQQVVISSDKGNSWQEAFPLFWPNRMTARGNTVAILSISTDSITYTTDGGATWAKSFANLSTSAVPNTVHLDSRGTLWIDRHSNGLVYSANWTGAAVTWDTAKTAPRPISSSWILPNDDIFAFLLDSAVYKSSDRGIHWEKVADTKDEPALSFWSGPLFDDGALIGYRSEYLGQWSYNVLRRSYYLRRAPGDSTWVPLQLPPGTEGSGRLIQSAGLLYNYAGRLYRSTDTGATWRDITSNLQTLEPFQISTLSNGEFVLRSDLGLHISRNSRTEWESRPYFGDNISTGAADDIYVLTDSAVVASFDAGMTFERFPIPSYLQTVRDIVCDSDGNVYIATGSDTYEGPDTVFVTHNRGASWGPFLIKNDPMIDLRFSPRNTFFLSSNFEIIWQKEGAAIFDSVFVPLNQTERPSVFAITRDDTYLGHSQIIANVIVSFTPESKVFDSKLYNNPLSWKGSMPRCLTQDVRGMYYMSDLDDVYRSDSYWGPWEPCSDGLHDYQVTDLYYDESDDRLYAATFDGIYRTVLPVVSATAPPLPTHLALSQNYPNPFNPGTTIEYTLPTRTEVTLRVYNGLGKLVATRASGMMEAGTHSVAFDASDLPSGVYFYRLEADGVRLTKSMVVMK